VPTTFGEPFQLHQKIVRCLPAVVGALARQVIATWSNAGGDIGASSVIGFGSLDRIAAMRLALVSPPERRSARGYFVEHFSKAKISVRASASLPSTALAPCTGMYREGCLRL